MVIKNTTWALEKEFMLRAGSSPCAPRPARSLEEGVPLPGSCPPQLSATGRLVAVAAQLDHLPLYSLLATLASTHHSESPVTTQDDTSPPPHSHTLRARLGAPSSRRPPLPRRHRRLTEWACLSPAFTRAYRVWPSGGKTRKSAFSWSASILLERCVNTPLVAFWSLLCHRRCCLVLVS